MRWLTEQFVGVVVLVCVVFFVVGLVAACDYAGRVEWCVGEAEVCAEEE